MRSLFLSCAASAAARLRSSGDCSWGSWPPSQPSWLPQPRGSRGPRSLESLPQRSVLWLPVLDTAQFRSYLHFIYSQAVIVMAPGRRMHAWQALCLHKLCKHSTSRGRGWHSLWYLIWIPTSPQGSTVSVGASLTCSAIGQLLLAICYWTIAIGFPFTTSCGGGGGVGALA